MRTSGWLVNRWYLCAHQPCLLSQSRPFEYVYLTMRRNLPIWVAKGWMAWYGGWRKVSSEKEGNLMMMMMMRMVPDPHLQVLWSGELSQVLCKVLTTQPASKQWRRSRRGIMTFGNRKMRRIEFFFFHFFLSLECRANCDLISPYLEHLAFLHNT